MRITYEQLDGIRPALSKLSKLDLKATEAVKLARLVAKAESELKLFEDTKISLFKKYGEEEKGGFRVKDENREAFFKEYRELCNTDINFDVETFSIKSEISIDAASVLALEGFVDFG